MGKDNISVTEQIHSSVFSENSWWSTSKFYMWNYLLNPDSHIFCEAIPTKCGV